MVARRLRPPLRAALLAERLVQRDRGARLIRSTLDAATQAMAERRVAAHVAALPPRTSAAVLVVDNATLEARAYVGSALFGDPARLGHVDMVAATRSPGLDAEALPLRPRARRRPDPFRKPAGRCAAATSTAIARPISATASTARSARPTRCACRSTCRRSTCSRTSGRRASPRGCAMPASRCSSRAARRPTSSLILGGTGTRAGAARRRLRGAGTRRTRRHACACATTIRRASAAC